MSPKSKAGTGGARATKDAATDEIDTATPPDGGLTDGSASVEDAAVDASPPTAPTAGASGATAGKASAGAGGTTVMMTATTAAPPADRGPYYTSGRFKGYYWTALHGVGTTVRATNFNQENYSMPICITGTVATSADSSSNAMLGINLNQAHAVDAMPMTLTPQQDGIMISVTNKGGSVLRLQIETPEGATKPEARWCAYVEGSGGFIPWSQFTTTCWDDLGTAYAREPISVASVLIPGNPTTSVPYDVCLNSIVEAANSGGTVTTRSAAATGTGGTGGTGGKPVAGSTAGTAGSAAP